MSLATNGQLQMELPGTNGDRRTVRLRDKTALDIIKRTLRELEQGQVIIGQGGAPTRHQVKHMELHTVFPDPRCPFCREKMIENYLKKQGKIQSDQDLMKIKLDL